MLRRKKVKIIIRGLSPLLQNNPIQMGAKDPNKASVKRVKPEPAVEAESTTYRDANGALYVPSSAIFGCMLNAATDLKQPGTRKSLSTILRGATLGITDVTGTREKITIRDFNGNPKTEIAIYASRCVIQKAGIIKHRAKVEDWQLEFIVEHATDYISASQPIIEALERGGIMVGIGDYRPEKKGEFGRFEVVSFEEVV